MTKTLILVRHGVVEGAKPGTLLGSTDARLSEGGRRQVEAIKNALAAVAIDRFVCSPLARARETADILAAGRTVPVEVEPDLREMDFGAWEGLTYGEVEQRDLPGARAWSELSADFVFPGGESFADFGARIAQVAKVLTEAGGGTVVAVTHGGVIRGLVCHYLGLPLRNYLLFDVTPGAVVTLRLWGERGVLTGLRQPGGSAGSLET